MPALPFYIPLLFFLTAAATLLLFDRAVIHSQALPGKKAGSVFLAMIAWLAIQAALAVNHVYSADTRSLPPKIVLFGIAPPVLVLILLFATKSGRRFIDRLPLLRLTWLHAIRIPVEIVLLLLFIHQAVPQLMTFEGRNFDILAGLTAPFIAYYGVKKASLHRRLILAWNFISLALLLNIVIHAFLSAPSPLQRLAFDRPNIAILHFPFSWLPTFIVPVVLFSHLAAIRQLIRRQSSD
ncbi:MAG: hypothetical protein ABW019_09190 [Chitinophagaceae bacterium]